MKTETRPTEFVGIKLPPELAEKIRRRARAEDRPVSAFLRRLISEALAGR